MREFMENKYPLLTEYKKTLPKKFLSLKTLIEKLKENYTIENLNELRKEVHKLGNQTGLYGYGDVSQLCNQLEIDLIAKGKNFYYFNPSSTWFLSLDTFLNSVERSFFNQVTPMQESKIVKTEKKQIVIVDDDEDILKLLDYEFHELGYEVHSFQTGQKALDFFSKKENDSEIFLLILDRMLPDMDGLDVLQKVQGRFPVLIISVLDSESDIITGLQEGAIDYITKPFSVFLLMQKALNLLKSNR